MVQRFSRFGLVMLLAGVGMLTVGMGQTGAQNLNEGWKVLEDKFTGGPRGLVREFLNGRRVDPNDKSHTEAIDLLAKTYTYGVYLQKSEAKHDGILKDFQGFQSTLEGVTTKARDREAIQTFVDVFRDRVRIHALEVIQFKEARPIHKIYNARVLAEIAKLGEAQLADTLILVLKDREQNDAVHYEVLKGLDTLIPLLQPPQKAKCAVALVEFLEQKKGPAKNASREEIEGFRFFRRAALRALANIHTPAINDKIRPALVLARFAGNDMSIQPPPRIDERVEAAIGLANMTTAPKEKLYQADYAAGQIAKCLGTMAKMAENERANRNDPNNKEARIYPWRILAAQFKESLDELKKNNDKNAYVVKIADRGAQLLTKIIKSEQINSNELSYWSSAESDPPSKELFQGSPDSVIKPGQAVDTESEK